MKLRVLIAEDEPLSRAHLRRMLEADPMVELVAECATGPETLQAIQAARPDLVLLEVRLPALDAFEVIKGLPGPELPIFVFVTASDQFAFEAFQIHAADYLLKPFNRERLDIALHRVRDRLRRTVESTPNAPDLTRGVERLTIKSQGRISFVKLAEVDWFSASDNYVEVHAGKTTHLLRTTVSALESELPAKVFARVSRSVLVNLERLQEIRPQRHGDFLVILEDGTRLRGTRNYRHNLPGLLVQRKVCSG